LGTKDPLQEQERRRCFILRGGEEGKASPKNGFSFPNLRTKKVTDAIEWKAFFVLEGRSLAWTPGENRKHRPFKKERIKGKGKYTLRERMSTNKRLPSSIGTYRRKGRVLRKKVILQLRKGDSEKGSKTGGNKNRDITGKLSSSGGHDTALPS